MIPKERKFQVWYHKINNREYQEGDIVGVAVWNSKRFWEEGKHRGYATCKIHTHISARPGDHYEVGIVQKIKPIGVDENGVRGYVIEYKHYYRWEE